MFDQIECALLERALYFRIRHTRLELNQHFPGRVSGALGAKFYGRKRLWIGEYDRPQDEEERQGVPGGFGQTC